MSFIRNAYGATKLALKANAPTIMVVTGVVSMGASVIAASRQTLKVETVLHPHVKSVEKIDHGTSLGLESYSEQDALQDRIRVYGYAGVDMAKLYAVPGVLFVGGAALVFGGHRIMLKRNATLAIAFTGLKKTFDAYRSRVVDELGSEVDQAMYGGWTTEEVLDDKGKPTGEVQVRDWESSGLDPYNRVFEQGASESWKADLHSNRLFIQNQNRFAQERLAMQGHLYLSDVYEALGFPESDISRVVGWKVRRNPDGSKDIPVIDFGLDKPHPDDWKYTKEGAIYLDFNCQGLIVGGKVQKLLEDS